MTLKEAHLLLVAKGIAMGYSTLSELLAPAEVVSMLKIETTAGGSSPSKDIRPEVVDLLAELIPEFRLTGLKNRHWVDWLRARIVPADEPSGAIVPFGPSAEIPHLKAAMAQGREEGLASTDEILTPTEAAEFCRTTVRRLRLYGPRPFMRIGSEPRDDRYRKSDLLRSG